MTSPTERIRGKWRVYMKRAAFWPNTWVALPPNEIPGFGEQYQFHGARAFDKAVDFATQQARGRCP